MEKIIDKVLEKGWKPLGFEPTYWSDQGDGLFLFEYMIAGQYPKTGQIQLVPYEKIVLDKTFWEAIGYFHSDHHWLVAMRFYEINFDSGWKIAMDYLEKVVN